MLQEKKGVLHHRLNERGSHVKKNKMRFINKKLTDFVGILSANLKTAFTSHPVVLQFFSCPYKDVQLLFMPFQFDIKYSGSFLLTKL